MEQIDVPLLEELLVMGENQWLANGMSQEIREERRKRLKLQYALRKNILADKASGLSHRQIAEKRNTSQSNISKYVHGGLPSLMHGLLRDHKRKNHVRIPSPGSVPLAQFLGLALAHTDTGTEYKRSLIFGKYSREDPDYVRVKHILKSAFGEQSFSENKTKERDRTLYRVGIQSRNLFDWFKEVTQDYTRIPWEYLPDEDTKAGLLEGHFIVSLLEHKKMEHWSTDALFLTKTRDGRLLEDLCLVAEDLGTFPRYTDKGHQKLVRFTDPDDVEVLIDRGTIPDRLLESARSVMQKKRRSHTILKQYLRVHRLKAQRRGVKKIAKTVGIEERKVEDWLGDVTPAIVSRYEDLKLLWVKHPKADAIHYLWSECNLSPLVARKTVNQYRSSGEFQTALGILRDLQIGKKDHGSWLKRGPTAIRKLQHPVYVYATERMGLENELAHSLTKQYSLDDLQKLVYCFDHAGVTKNDYPHLLALPQAQMFRELDEIDPESVQVGATSYDVSFRVVARVFEIAEDHNVFLEEHLPSNPPTRGKYCSNGVEFSLARDGDNEYTRVIAMQVIS